MPWGFLEEVQLLCSSGIMALDKSSIPKKGHLKSENLLGYLGSHR